MVIPQESLHPFITTETGNVKDFTSERGTMKDFSSQKEVCPFYNSQPVKMVLGTMKSGILQVNNSSLSSGKDKGNATVSKLQVTELLCCASVPGECQALAAEVPLLKAHWFPLSHCKIQGVFQKAPKPGRAPVREARQDLVPPGALSACTASHFCAGSAGTQPLD